MPINSVLKYILLLTVLHMETEGNYIYHRKSYICPSDLYPENKTECGVGGKICDIGKVCCFNGKGTTCACPNGLTANPCGKGICEITSCPSFPTAECMADNCGGCRARFVQNGILEVTPDCHS